MDYLAYPALMELMVRMEYPVIRDLKGPLVNPERMVLTALLVRLELLEHRDLLEHPERTAKTEWMDKTVETDWPERWVHLVFKELLVRTEHLE